MSEHDRDEGSSRFDLKSFIADDEVKIWYLFHYFFIPFFFIIVCWFFMYFVFHCLLWSVLERNCVLIFLAFCFPLSSLIYFGKELFVNFSCILFSIIFSNLFWKGMKNCLCSFSYGSDLFMVNITLLLIIYSFLVVWILVHFYSFAHVYCLLSYHVVYAHEEILCYLVSFDHNPLYKHIHTIMSTF